MAKARRSKGGLAELAWEALFDFVMSTAPARQQSLAKRGLTPNDARALFSLTETEGSPIGTLAVEWSCDPSTATFIVDRLEKGGLSQRWGSPRDRRVKLVMLTAKGAQTKKELQDEYYRAPDAIRSLPARDLMILTEILVKLAPIAPRGTKRAEKRARRGATN
jgi:DNA-binding MarR family transcriptional regulator